MLMFESYWVASMLNRRTFLLLMTSLAGTGVLAATTPAYAKDGDGGKGGDGGGGDGGGGGDDGGGGGGDDGGGNSGHGGGDDKGGDDDGRDGDRGDDDRDDDKNDDEDDDRIRDAVKRGEAESLRNILPVVRRKYPGKVVRIRLTGVGRRRTYRIRVIDSSNQLFEVRVDAQSGRIMGISNL